MPRLMILAVVAAVLLSLPTATPATKFVPVPRELAMAALAMDEELEPADHAGDWLRVYRPELHRRVERGDMDAGEAERRAVAEMRRLVAEFDPSEPLTLERSVYFRGYDGDRGAFRLDALFQERYFVAYESQFRTLPSNYLVLIANAELLDYLPMPAERAEAFRNRRMKLRGAAKRRLGVRVEYRLLDFQNGRDFQAVISRAVLYESPAHETKLHTFEEKRDFSRLINERLLAEGNTWQVEENHSFGYEGIRMLTLLPENHPAFDDCRDTGDRTAGHRRILCTQRPAGRSLATRRERLYVGGRLARVALYREEDWTEAHRRQLFLDLRGLGLPEASGIDSRVTWERSGAVLRYDPAALDPAAEAVPYLTVKAGPYVALAGHGSGGEDASVEADDDE